MKAIRIFSILLLFLVYGCASMKVNDFSEFELKKADILPPKSAVLGQRYKVFLEASKVSDYSRESKVDLDNVVKSVVEVILLDTSNVTFVSSSKDADYHVQSQLLTARLSSNVFEGRTNFYADIQGRLNIYDVKDGQIKKIFEFKDNSSESVQNATNRDLILNEAISDAIVYGAGDLLSEFFSAKGYVISGRKSDDDYIFEVTLGRDKLKVGDKLEVHNFEQKTNPLTNNIDDIDRIITSAVVIDNSASSRSWIRVKENGENIRLGDYVRFVNKKGLGKMWNNVAKKANKFIQNWGKGITGSAPSSSLPTNQAPVQSVRSSKPPIVTAEKKIKPQQPILINPFIPIDVVNPSFETSVPFTAFSVGGNFNVNVTGWKSTQIVGTFSPSTPGNPFGFNVFSQDIPDGVNTVFALGNGGISQVLKSTLAENTTYKLEVDVGDRSHMNLPDSHSAQLRVGNIVLASGSVTPENGRFSTLSIEYVSKSGDPFGAPIELLLLTTHSSSDPNGVQINWDNVRFSSKAN